MKSTRAYKEIAYSEAKPEPRFNKVIIVDSSEVDLFISETILNALHVAKEVKKQLSQDEVINFLNNVTRLSDVPELIFLNLDMPNDGGFRFLEEFNNLSDFIRSKCKIVVTTTALDQDTKHKVLMNPSVVRYLVKPLDVFQLKDFIYN
ncbi:MAG: response regulator [Bacteroidetes bacterium]|nr:response regulator [Bacteroidota bacterium]MBL0064159.1 response regulator [Bacteroidota bacterium]MBL0139459.1 response regulator [Bacteroidota bacterium]